MKNRYRQVIKETARKMGAGMAEFIEKDVESIADYDLYCHYVAGLVGYGLSELFIKSGLETDVELVNNTQLSNEMGLFLQKTNIIRDFHEDIHEDRVFWPSNVWKKHAKLLEDFLEPSNIDNAVRCLNELVTNALTHAPSVLDYLSRLKDQQIFNFCAIPQVMAIATLALIYNNKGVFKGAEKIRRGLAAKVNLPNLEIFFSNKK